MKKLTVKFYRALPLPVRDKLNLWWRNINKSVFLILIFGGFRHSLTCRYLSKSAGVKLMIGANQRFSGWIVTDYAILARHFFDVTRTKMPKGIAEFIHADNVIEHLDKYQGQVMISNIFHMLRPGGVLRLATPSLDGITSAFHEKSDTKIKEFAESMIEHKISVHTWPDVFRATFIEFGHDRGYVYDFDTLKHALVGAGFGNVTQTSPGESVWPELRNLESRVSGDTVWSQLVVEASKPLNPST